MYEGRATGVSCLRLDDIRAVNVLGGLYAYGGGAQRRLGWSGRMRTMMFCFP